MNDAIGKSLVESSLGDSWGGVALLFLGFCYFFAGSLGYAYRVQRWVIPRTSLLNRLSDTFLLASLLLFSSAFALAATHSLLLVPKWLGWALFLPGVFFLRPLAADCWRAAWGSRRFAVLVLFLVFFVRALSAAIPAQHGDPLLYHLLGPRLWMEAGGFLMHSNLPNALLASSWECLYLWPQLLWFSSSPFYGLVEAQLFSQWLHLFLAWGGCGLLAMRIFRGTVKDSWLPFAGLAALFISGVQWTAPLAKNDVGIAFWSLGAIVFFVEIFSHKKNWKGLISGIFAGLAICGKISALLSLAPILALILVFLRSKKNTSLTLQSLVLWVVGFALGATPIYVRNFLLSQNPFFPLFSGIFPSPWISKTWRGHFAQVHPSSPLHSLPRIFTRFPELLKETHWALGAFLLVLFVLLAKKKAQSTLGELAEKRFMALFIGSILAYVIFVLTQAPDVELRYVAAALMVLSAGGICFLLKFAEALPKGAAQNIAAAVLLLAALTTSKLPLHIVRKIWASPLGVNFVKTHSGGEAKSWLRAHNEGTFSILAGDNETYYLTPIGIAVLTERPDFDAANEKTVLGDFVVKLCELSHARYLLDARPEIGIEAKFGAKALLPAKVFEAQNSKVYDLRILEAQAKPNKLSCL